MKLRLSLFAVFIFALFLNASAQISTPEKGSIWIYKYGNIGSRGPVFSIYKRDSTIGGRSAIVLDETFYDTYRDPGKPDIDTISRLGSILCLKDSTVFYWNINQFDTLYDFGAEIGAEWTYYFAGREDTLKAFVLGKGVDSNLGAFVELEYTDKYDFPWKDTIYEFILGGSKYILPWDETWLRLDGHSGGPLQCFSNSSGRYSERTWTAGGAACTDIIEKLGVYKIAKENIFNIYPNPSKGVISIDANQKPTKMEVYSMFGKLIFSSDKEFKTPPLSSQIYTVKLWRKDGLLEVHRVVVE
ncbi:MAG: hypothetical protein QMC70_07460 [Bacteroidia bacterium]